MPFHLAAPVRRALLGLFTMTAAAATIPAAVYAQAPYPNRPVRLIAPFPPGGTSDVLARLIAAKLTDGLGQIVTVDNRAGASGNIGHEAAAKSPPDGYTLLLSNSSTVVTNPHRSMLASSLCSRGSASVIATPSRPARPTRPMRWT